MILVTGATGYVGGRLVGAFERQGIAVRCLARHPEHLQARVAATTTIVRGDVLDRGSLDAALVGVDVAYYLVHSMGSVEAFEATDREGAEHFGAAARAAGVRRLVYLGGLGEDRPDLSPHLRSRHEVGAILRASGVQVVELRASIVHRLRQSLLRDGAGAGRAAAGHGDAALGGDAGAADRDQRSVALPRRGASTSRSTAARFSR